HWLLIGHHLLERDEPVLIGGDETVVTKAGDKSYGLDRFFSSLYGKPVPGLAFFGLFLLSVKSRRSYPVMMEQVVKAPEVASGKKSTKLAEPKASKRKRGR